jgi:subtilisin family serine protease
VLLTQFRCDSTQLWLENFKQERQRKIDTSTEGRFKIAVLDTGVDMKHPRIQGHVKENISFLPGIDSTDESGHGTHIAGKLTQ